MGLSGHPVGLVAEPVELPAEHSLAAHWYRLQHVGFTIVPDAIPPGLLQELRDHFDETEARLMAGEEVAHCRRTEHGEMQINHLPLHKPSFAWLLDPPPVFPLVRKAMHAKYGEEPAFLDMADGVSLPKESEWVCVVCVCGGGSLASAPAPRTHRVCCCCCCCCLLAAVRLPRSDGPGVAPGRGVRAADLQPRRPQPRWRRDAVHAWHPPGCTPSWSGHQNTGLGKLRGHGQPAAHRRGPGRRGPDVRAGRVLHGAPSYLTVLC